MDLIKARNVAYEVFVNNPSDDNQHKLKEARHALLRSKRKAKRKWQLEFAMKCQNLDFKINPKDAWKMVFKLMEGFQSHHKTYIPKNFKNKSGIEAKNDTDNAKILNTHLYSLFNSKVQVDYSVLENKPQRETASQLDKAPSEKEIRSAINGMAHDKAPGQSGVTTDMIKNLPKQAFDLYVKIMQNFWEDEEIDFSAWHTTILRTIYKGKGDPQDPNNHRGIALKETSAKVMSIIIARRLLKRFREINPSTQFGHIGCQEALHIIKRALLLRRQHGLESHAVFVDLVKAFDTVNQDLLCKILQKYGLPPKLVATISKLYKDCQIKINIGKTHTKIDYTVGVHQEDNMSPILFLFVIQAFLETLQIEAEPINFSHFPENKNGNLKTCKGRLLSQKTSAKGTPFEFRTSFFVDDSFFIFLNRQELQSAIAKIDSHFARFGLTMHLGNKNTKSKMECMYFPLLSKTQRHNYMKKRYLKKYSYQVKKEYTS
jgi:hypothetical protein